jgi:hypothetical protein
MMFLIEEEAIDDKRDETKWGDSRAIFSQLISESLTALNGGGQTERETMMRDDDNNYLSHLIKTMCYSRERNGGDCWARRERVELRHI